MIDLLGNYGESGIKKGVRFTDKKYILFIREQPDEVEILRGKKIYGVEAHHLIYLSRGAQASDVFAVPLLQKYHTGTKGYHTLGRHRFFDLYGIDWNKVVKRLWEEYTGLSLDHLAVGLEREQIIECMEYCIKQVK